MEVSRRNFFKGMGAILGTLGLSRLLGGQRSLASDQRHTGDGKVGIEWLGHGSFLFISCTGKRILLDPWISTNPKCPGKYRQEKGFGRVDFILWTHGHVDHFMLSDAKALITQYQPKIIAPWELNFFIKSEIPEANCQTFTLGNKGSTAQFADIQITMVEAFHSAGAQLIGFEGTNRFVGEAVGYIIQFENGLRIYHSGDTSLMGDMKTIIGDFYQPDIAILPIGGVFTMGPDEAAYACKLIQPKKVIPEHYGTFPVLVQSCDRFKEQIRQWAQDVKVLETQPGEPIQV
jgi:L-ascorbate metabolism protein UlaG (beta-lactamase superfamily)